MCDGFTGPVGTICDPGLQGPKGMPGPYCADSERDLIVHLICELEQADYYGERIGCQDGELPTWRLNEVLKLAADGIEDILDRRMDTVAELFTSRTDNKRRRTA